MTQDWVATAPMPARTNGQIPPTPGTAVETATPTMPVRAQRAAIEKVLSSSIATTPSWLPLPRRQADVADVGLI